MRKTKKIQNKQLPPLAIPNHRCIHGTDIYVADCMTCERDAEAFSKWIVIGITEPKVRVHMNLAFSLYQNKSIDYWTLSVEFRVRFMRQYRSFLAEQSVERHS